MNQIERDLKKVSKLIGLAKSEIALRDRIFEVQKEAPEVLNPNFKFEGTDKYKALRIEEWELNKEKTKVQIQDIIDNYEVQKKELEEQLKGE